MSEFRVSNYANPFMYYAPKAMEPLYEAKPDSEIFALIAEKLGLSDDVPLRTPEEWIDIVLDSEALKVDDKAQRMLDGEVLRFVGKEDEPFMRGADGTFPTPSGRAELYCEAPLPRVDFGQDWQDAADNQHFPTFEPPTENWHETELAKKYPLSYIQSHERYRTHTQWYAVETLRELDPEPLLHLSPQDAVERGIADGDIAEVFNDRGTVVIKTVIDDACPQGVCHIPKGWQRNQFIEGCYQDLTGAASDPMAVNFAYFDARVDVRKK